VGGWVA